MSILPKSTTQEPALTWKQAVAFSVAAIVSFHFAYSFNELGFLILVYLYGLCALTRLGTDRRAFYIGLTIGMLIYGPQLYFFYTIFGAAAAVLWLVLAFWLALFLLLARRCRERLGKTVAALAIPFLWTGLEYFRSELYYLRFSWLNVGYMFDGGVFPPFLKWCGVYGAGFVVMAIAVALSLWYRIKVVIIVLLLAQVILFVISLQPIRHRGRQHDLTEKLLPVAGVQMEFPAPLEVPLALDKLLKKNPDAQLLVLSEYTFDGPVPDQVKAWCKKNNRHLIAGGKAPVSGNQFYNTAFVIDTNGGVAFQQVKSVPIQFFKDGLPAKEQKVWNSPWGKIGICVCYDLSYTRVTDELIRQGAQALIVPTMDVAEWGGYQHRLHARVAPVRAAEYGVPIFRVCSSGISQLIDRNGHVIATASFPGEQASISGQLRLKESGGRPLDRWLAPLSVLVTAVSIIWLGFCGLRRRSAASNFKP